MHQSKPDLTDKVTLEPILLTEVTGQMLLSGALGM
jgi:hypothetical protein